MAASYPIFGESGGLDLAIEDGTDLYLELDTTSAYPFLLEDSVGNSDVLLGEDGRELLLEVADNVGTSPPAIPKAAAPAARTTPKGWAIQRGRSSQFPARQTVTPIPALVLPAKQARAYRGWLLRRGRRNEFPQRQTTLPIPVYPVQRLSQRRAQRGWLFRRGRRAEFPTRQATLPIPILPLVNRQKRAQRGWLFRRGRRAEFPQRQTPPPIPVLPLAVKQARVYRGWLLRRGRNTTVAQAQLIHPRTPDRIARSHRQRGWRLVRGRAATFLPQYDSLPVQQKRTVRGWRFVRGHREEYPMPAQNPPPLIFVPTRVGRPQLRRGFWLRVRRSSTPMAQDQAVDQGRKRSRAGLRARATPSIAIPRTPHHPMAAPVMKKSPKPTSPPRRRLSMPPIPQEMPPTVEPHRQRVADPGRRRRIGFSEQAWMLVLPARLRRVLVLRRGRRIEPAPTQDSLQEEAQRLPPQLLSARHRAFLPLWRRRTAHPVGDQPWVDPARVSRADVELVRRASRLVIQQAEPPLPANATRASRRPLRAVLGRRAVVASPAPEQPLRASGGPLARRLVALRRMARPTTIAGPPHPVAFTRVRVRTVPPRRGRVATPVREQVPLFPPPYPVFRPTYVRRLVWRRIGRGWLPWPKFATPDYKGMARVDFTDASEEKYVDSARVDFTDT